MDIYHLPRLNQEQTGNLNQSTTSKDIESVIKSLPTRKIPGPDGFIGKFFFFLPNIKEEFMSTFLKLLQTPKRMENSRTHFMGLASKPDKHTTRKENYRPISLMTIDTKKFPTRY